jgi:hypothetical protein
MKDQLLAVIKIARNDDAVQISFSNGAERAFVDFNSDTGEQIHYIGDKVVTFSDVYDHISANADYIEMIA